MNTEQELRLEKIFTDNKNKGIAIAITGCWGIGKTFSWKKFRNYYLSKNKYVYVSLFGLESLNDLKTHIYSHIENNKSPIEIPKWLRGLPSILKDTKLSHFGISTSANILDSLMFNQVKDAIICFDDFERMSKKLDIKDVMGLANQLKVERNCQVILILDEFRADEENQKKYAEYKEKLIDETIKINSVESLLRENAKKSGIDESLVDLMVKFADELEIHNFRFFHKIIKLYKQFREQLPQHVADSTKKIILIRILQGYFIEDFGQKYEFDWDDIKLVLEEKQKDWSERKRKTYESLKSVNYNFIHFDEWSIEFKKWFDQKDNLDLDILYNLANSEIISEQNNIKKHNFHHCFDIFWNLKANEEFPNQLYIATKDVIGLDHLSNISFALELLEILGKNVDSLEKEILEWIKVQIDRNVYDFIISEKFGRVRPSFIKYKNEYVSDKKNFPNLIEAIFNRYVKRAWSDRDILTINNANKNEWYQLLFIDVPNDSRFNTFVSSYLVKEILTQHAAEHRDEIRSVIKEIYEEKSKESDFYNKYMNYLVSRLDN